MKIFNWNIVSFRSLIKKNNIIDNKKSKNNTFHNYIIDNGFDILCLQEIKLNEKDLHILDEYFPEYPYKYVNISHTKKGYSGVAILSKFEAISFDDHLLHNNGKESEGRYIQIEFDKFYLINVYFPNAGEELKRLHYKNDFNKYFFNKVKKLKEKKEVIITGDFNAIQYEFDTYNFEKHFNHLAGVTEDEMKFLNKLVDNGFNNSFRELHGNKKQYSYFSYRWPGRMHNKGLLIDFVLTTDKIFKKINSIKYLDNIYGSDHLPIVFKLDI
jgi:exodeoxyribonuclease III